MRPKIVVVGSSNTDMVVRASHLPIHGETVLGEEFVMLAGGKGANQAVAAARLGAEVVFVARVGGDMFGDKSLETYRAAGINVDYIARDADAASGVALITVDQNGENIITVAPGANSNLSTADVASAGPVIKQSDCMLLQLEIPLATVRAAIELAHRHHVRVILNPAPAGPLPDDLLRLVDILTPNENEAALLATHFASQVEALLALLSPRGSLIITRGQRGAELIQHGGNTLLPAYVVTAVDTTGAGDAFNGALATALARGTQILEAVRYANAAAALSVTRFGAQTSLPTHAEVIQLMRTNELAHPA